MTFMAWPEIEAFYNIRKYTAAHPEILNGNSTALYKAKVKLHGTNAAVQVGADGTIECQSRSGIITPENDNAGFARWVMSNKKVWADVSAPGWIFYGEWCGPGIQKGVAISEIPKKIFAIFAARPLDGSDTLVVEPNELAELVYGTLHSPQAFFDGVYILPWYARALHGAMHAKDIMVDYKVNIDWSQPSEELVDTTTDINHLVSAVEVEDPWVKATFDVKGTGEGLVFYPLSQQHLGFANFSNLVFKAKGEKHKNIKTAAPAQVNPEVAASVEAFVELVLTPARLEQGARAILGEHKHEDKLNCLFCITGALTYDMKNTGKFVSWCLADVQKETTDELEASQLDWKQVQKPLGDKARAWFLEQAKK